MADVEVIQMEAKQKSQYLRITLHEDVDKYFDAIDERIDSFCQQNLEAVAPGLTASLELEKMKTLATELDKLSKLQERSILAEAEELVSKAQELVTTLDSNEAVGVRRVSLERNPDWSLEGAVTLQFGDDMARKPKVNSYVSLNLAVRYKLK